MKAKENIKITKKCCKKAENSYRNLCEEEIDKIKD